jgi:thiamine-phosphate pyrophosphorylase
LPRSNTQRLSVPDRQEAILAALRACPLYFILDESLFRVHDPLELTSTVVRAGVRMLQLRTKKMSRTRRLELAQEVRKITRIKKCLFIVNDSLELAQLCGADGVHLGAEDMTVAAARITAPELIIGATARTTGRAWKAEVDGADYLGCGSVFPSSTKSGLPLLGLRKLRALNRYVSIPVVGIGGITLENCEEVLATEVAGFCSIAPFLNHDPAKLVKQFKTLRTTDSVNMKAPKHVTRATGPQ